MEQNNKKELEVYVPTLVEEKPIPIDKESTQYSGSLTKLADKDGIIEVQLESRVVKQRIAKDLYSSYLSGLRELYNNEARACRMARKMGARPRIEITLDIAENLLIIHGIDSLGITEEVFNKVVRVLGVSGNLSGEEVGQFGFGFASYTTLSDLMKIETWARETDERYTLMAKNGIDFQILPPNKLETYGTRLTLTYNEDVKPDQLIEHLIQYAKFSKVETVLINKTDIEVDRYRNDEDWSSFANAGRYEMPHYNTLREYIDAVYSVDRNAFDGRGKSSTKWKIDVNINNDDFEFEGNIYAYKNAWGESVQSQRTGEVVLLGTPIETNIKFGGLSSYVLNIKNERKYLPTADRDRLTDKSAEEIQQTVQGKIDEFFAQFNLTNVNDWLASEHKTLYTQRELHFDETTRAISDLIQLYIHITKDKSNHRSTSILTEVTKLNEKIENLVYVAKYEDDLVKEIKKRLPNSFVFRFDARHEGLLPDYMNIGLIDGNEYLKNQKVKITRLSKQKDDVVIHYSHVGTTGGWSGSPKISKTTKHIKTVDLNNCKIVQADKEELQNIFVILSNTLSDYTAIRKTKKVKAETIKEISERVKDNAIETSDGMLKISEIFDTKKDIVLLCYDMTEVAYYMKNKLRRYVICSDFNQMFEIACYSLNHKNTVLYDASGDLIEKDFINLADRNLYMVDFYRARHLLDVIYVKSIASPELYSVFLTAVDRHLDESENLRDSIIKIVDTYVEKRNVTSRT